MACLRQLSDDEVLFAEASRRVNATTTGRVMSVTWVTSLQFGDWQAAKTVAKSRYRSLTPTRGALPSFKRQVGFGKEDRDLAPALAVGKRASC